LRIGQITYEFGRSAQDLAAFPQYGGRSDSQELIGMCASGCSVFEDFDGSRSIGRSIHATYLVSLLATQDFDLLLSAANPPNHPSGSFASSSSF
jgi:hypothetical protein